MKGRAVAAIATIGVGLVVTVLGRSEPQPAALLQTAEAKPDTARNLPQQASAHGGAVIPNAQPQSAHAPTAPAPREPAAAPVGLPAPSGPMPVFAPGSGIEYEALNKVFAQEEPDAAGSAALSQHYTDALNDLDMEGAIDEVSCRKTLCRVVAHFADISQALRFQDEAGMPERRKGINVEVVDGQIDVEVFVARD